jgi:sugar/nucleoside kinase (ribokinase family)
MHSDRDHNIVIVGNVSYDSVIYPESTATFWGGGGLNVALAAGNAGAITTLLSVAGRDAKSMLELVGRFIDVDQVSIVDEETCRFLIEYDKNGDVLKTSAYYNAANKLDSVISNYQFRGGHYHVCCRKPLSPQYLLERLVALNLQFSLDFVSTSAAEIIPLVNRWMGLSRFVFVNRREFEILRGIRVIEDLQELVVTTGSDPVCVYQYGREVGRWDCLKKEFVDVTGAGDVFVGTYLGTRLLGEDIASSVKRAIVEAQHSIDGRGVLGITNRRSKNPGLPEATGEDNSSKSGIRVS